MKRDDASPPAPDRDPPTGRPPVSWERAADLFAAALEIPVAERRQWLNGLSEVDEALRREVASLLEAHENARDFLVSDEY